MKKVLKIIYIVYVFGVVSLIAKSGGIEVRPTREELFETEPQNIVTTVFRVSNVGSPRQEFVSQLELPEGWKLITQDFPFELDTNASDIKLISFYVPPTALAGKYEVTYRVRGRKYPSVSDFYTIYVIVLPVKKVSIKLLEKPKYVIGGEKYSLSYLLKNDSNVKVALSLKFESGKEYPIILNTEIDTSYCEMMPGASKIISVTVETNKNISYLLKHGVILKVKSLKDNSIIGSASSWVNVIPQKSVGRSPYYYFPIKTLLRAFYSRRDKIQLGYQINVQGEGTLDEEGKTHLQFHLRGPDAYKKSVLGQYDEYNVSYSNDKFAIRVGDLRYSLSFLTENSRYGRGIEGSFNLRGFTFGAFYQKARWMFAANREFASYISYLIKNQYKIGFNYIRKEMDNSSGNVFSLEGKFKVHNTGVQVETALGQKDGKTRYSHWVNVVGREAKVNYSLRVILASPDFPGYYRDTHYITAGVSLPVWKGLRVKAGFHHNQQNFDLDTTRYSAPLTEQAYLGFRYHFRKGVTCGIYLNRRSSVDRLLRLFDYRENNFRFEISRNLRKLTLFGSFATGKTWNKLIDKTSRMNRYAISGYFVPATWQSYRAYVYYDEDMRYVFGEEHRFTVGLNLKLKIDDRMSFYLNYQNNSSTEEYYENRDLVEARLDYQFLNGRQISLRCRQTLLQRSLDRRETAFLLEYKAPFNIRIRKKENLGILKGRLFNIETNEPVRGVVVSVGGSTVVTDNKGNFVFSSLSSGTYYLRIDRAKIGLSMITIPETPMKITVHAKEKKYIEIGITRGAVIAGRVILYSSLNDSTVGLQKETGHKYYLLGDGKTKVLKNHALPDILVEIRKDGEVQRRITDSEGRFDFEGLRSGRWKLKLYKYNLPEHYRFEKDTFEVKLRPGEKKYILVKVVPKKRRIRFLEKGGTVIQEERK